MGKMYVDPLVISMEQKIIPIPVQNKKICNDYLTEYKKDTAAHNLLSNF